LLSVKLGDEAIDRPDRVAEGVVYAVDAGAKVLDVTTAALGQTPSMRAAVEYAYRHGVTIAWASNDFDSADHTEGMRFAHVWPGNSLVADQSNRQGQNPGPGRSQPNDVTTTTFRSRSTLTSYGAHALFSVPSPDGSTSAGTPTTAGVAALVTSAGLDAVAQHQLAWPLDASEVFQVTRATASPIAYTPCPTCFPGKPGAERNVQYGYGRPNVFRAMKAVHDGQIPPTADIVAPDWYRQIDPALTRTLPITVAAAAKRSPSYHWEIQYGLGPQPTDGQFRTIATGGGNGPRQITRNLDLSQIPRQFSDGSYQAPPADRLSIERYDVTVRVRVTDVHGRLGEDRRVFQLRHDPSEIAALHQDLGTSIESQPTLADIEGRGSLDTIVAGSDGTIHAFRGRQRGSGLAGEDASRARCRPWLRAELPAVSGLELWPVAPASGADRRAAGGRRPRSHREPERDRVGRGRPLLRLGRARQAASRLPGGDRPPLLASGGPGTRYPVRAQPLDRLAGRRRARRS